MSATVLSPTAGHRYIPPGVRQYYWVETIADKTAPTRSELDAGTDLTAEIADVGGFEVTSDSADAPDLASRFTSKVPAMTEAKDSSLNVYISKNPDTTGDARTLLTRDAEGYVVVFPEGDDGGTDNHLMDVFPATIASSSIQPDTDKVAQLVVSFTITAEPEQNLAVPTTA